jgi:hypothetical protein
MNRRIRWTAGVAGVSSGVVILTAVFAAPKPKDSEPGPPMSDEQVRAVLADKGELTWADGQYRLKAKAVEGKNLVNIELAVTDKGKVVSTLTAPTVRIRVNRDKETMTLFVEEGHVEKAGVTIDLRDQTLDVPAPRQGKRP